MTSSMLKLPCFDFTWNGNESPKIQSIVHDIMTKNPRGLIPSSHETLKINLLNYKYFFYKDINLLN